VPPTIVLPPSNQRTSLLSGGADSTISIWDLDAPLSAPNGPLRPLGSVPRTAAAHKFGITCLSYYPFDSLAFLSSSFDGALKIYDSTTLTPSASFPLLDADDDGGGGGSGSGPVYAHAMSPIADHLLVACATRGPAVRLVDLRSGARSQALAGHAGPVLAVAWSPVEEHVVASGGADGTVRLWDVRRSAGQLQALDVERSADDHGGANGPAVAHAGPVNGLVWTEDGRHLVSAGHDERLRVWRMPAGTNTLANFGPLVKNKSLSRVLPLLVPTSLADYGNDMMLFPSEKEILMFELFDGVLVRRLRAPSSVASSNEPERVRMAPNARQVKDLAWRSHSVEFYSAHTDGSIRAWKTPMEEDSDDDDENQEEVKLKRQALEDIYRDVTKRRFVNMTDRSNA
jgi:DNA excision repair protein ERCC-8